MAEVHSRSRTASKSSRPAGWPAWFRIGCCTLLATALIGSHLARRFPAEAAVAAAGAAVAVAHDAPTLAMQRPDRRGGSRARLAPSPRVDDGRSDEVRKSGSGREDEAGKSSEADDLPNPPAPSDRQQDEEEPDMRLRA